MKKLVAGIIAAVALILAGFGIAQASIPAADGTINGCYKNSTGDVRVIDSAASCPSGYTALNWESGVGRTEISGYTFTKNDYEIPAGYQPTTFQMNVGCPSSTAKAIGGGFKVGSVADWNVFESASWNQGPGLSDGWTVRLGRVAEISTAQNASVEVICAVVN